MRWIYVFTYFLEKKKKKSITLTQYTNNVFCIFLNHQWGQFYRLRGIEVSPIDKGGKYNLLKKYFNKEYTINNVMMDWFQVDK